MSRRRSVLFYFLHLLGIGHVQRAKRIVAALHARNIDVDVLYGGLPLKELELAARSVSFLPPIQVEDATYQNYLDGNGDPLDDKWMKSRRDVMLTQFENLTPDCILVEAFPFGRRVVRHELAALFEAARSKPAPPLIVSSVRDILHEGRKPGRAEETCNLVRSEFDAVLVHADPVLIKLDSTFPLADQIADRLYYTGFVGPDATANSPAASSDILVSAGGGAFGAKLISTAMQAGLDDPKQRDWHIVAGPNCEDDLFARLSSHSTSRVRLTRSVSNLPAHLASAGTSVSQCGYNTTMEALAAQQDHQTNLVFIPHDAGNQTEQLRRAQLLADQEIAICLPETELNVPSLLQALDDADNRNRVVEINFQGAENSAKLIDSFICQHQMLS